MIPERIHALYDCFCGVFACRPDVFIAGFQKCGTTSLYYWLFQSPDLTAGRVKENNILAEHPKRKLLYLAKFPNRFQAKRTGCASHQIGFIPGGAKLLKSNFPNAKVLFVVRDPVERAVSRYMDNQRKGPSRQFDPKFQKTFDQLVLEEICFYQNLGENLTLESIYPFCAKESPFGYPVGRGLYDVVVKTFLDVGLPVYVTSLDILHTGFDNEFSDICRFFGITRPDHLDTVPKNVRPEYSKAEAYSADILMELQKFYEPHNRVLEEMAGRSLFLV